ncbi:MAG TPA: hypothetical protein VIU61_23225 [Kofleriaceae bacterium]
MTRDTMMLEGASHARRSLVIPLLACVLLASVIAIVDSRRAVSGPSWWCIEGSQCFATRAACMGPPLGDECVARQTAWCSYECLNAAYDDGRGIRAEDAICTTFCGTEPDQVCTPDSIECVEAAPPREPQLFPNYHRPGWWCGEVLSEGRQRSWCSKDRRDCEWFVQVPTGNACGELRQVDVECSPRAGAVFCRSFVTDGAVDFACAPTLESCQAPRFAGGKPLSGCELWPYD